MRLIALVLTGLFAAAIFASSGREFGYVGAPTIPFRATLVGEYLALGDGCLKVGVIDPAFRQTIGRSGLFSDRSWHHDWITAWRPFHVQPGCGMRFGGAKFLAIPLWPGVLAALALAAWSHGTLSALSVLRSRSCRVCGYDLSGSQDARSPCPECGHAR